MSTTCDEKQIRSLGNVLVTGGSGFLGNHIVTLLASRKACSQLTVLDLKAPVNPVPGVNYERGDLTDYDSMLKVFGKHKFDGVIHTASPVMTASKNKDLTYKVNVEGTKTMVRAAQETGVKAFVYTSSASVILGGKNELVNADETWPLVVGKEQPEYYTTTKVSTTPCLCPAHFLT